MEKEYRNGWKKIGTQMCPCVLLVEWYIQFLGYMVFLFGSRIRIFFFFIFENEVNFSIYFFIFIFIAGIFYFESNMSFTCICMKKRFVVPIGTYQIHSQAPFPQTIRPKGFFFKPTQHAHG